MNERRQEARFEVAAPAALTPLGTVADNLPGHVMNVSTHGVAIRISGPTAQPPRVGDLYRIRSSSDRMLCRVAYAHESRQGTDIGFRIVYWNEPGELNKVISDHSGKNTRETLRTLRIPQLV